MSFQAMAAAVRYKAANSTQKLVLILLANYADETGLSYPAQATLATDGSMSIDSVQRALRDLEGSGALNRLKRYRRNGSRTSDAILLTIEGLPGVVPEDLKDPEPQSAAGVTTPHSAATENDTTPHSAAPNTANCGQPSRTMRRPEPITYPIEKDSAAAANARSAEFDKAFAARLWTLFPDELKTDGDKKRVLVAINRTVLTTDDPAAVEAGVGRYYQFKADRGEVDVALPLHHMLADRLWEKFQPRQRKTRGGGGDGESFDATPKPPPPGLSLPEIQARIVRDWLTLPENIRESMWNTKTRGAPPGQEGCGIPPDILRACGVTPFEDQTAP